MSGGGGDGGYGERQDKIDADKTAARASLNALFGISTPGSKTSAAGVDRAAFTRQGVPTHTYSEGAGDVYTPSSEFDQAGYDAAVSSGNSTLGTDATKNKADLESLYSTTRDNAFTAGKRRIDEQKSDAGRNLKFELFSRGQNGGSTDIDQNALLGRTYSQGITDLGARADSVATGLRSDNERARLGLLQSIDNGMDSSSAVSSALGQMKVASDQAAADATGTAIGDLFGGTGLIYQQARTSQGRLAAGNQSGTSPLFARGNSGSLTSTGR
jgi:hypothetical protein